MDERGGLDGNELGHADDEVTARVGLCLVVP